MATTTVEFVDVIPLLQSLVSDIAAQPSAQTSLFVDFEGEKLSREGKLSLITIFIQPTNKVYIIDVHTLREFAFATTAGDGKTTTLKNILESHDVKKCFFDARNDSDALYAHYGIRLNGVEDVQLMEVASRPAYKDHQWLHGLESCIQYDAGLPSEEMIRWHAVKEKGKDLYSPKRPGSYEVFFRRPLPEELKQYCANDVTYLPILRQKYLAHLSLDMKNKVDFETARRILESWSHNYKPHGPHKAHAPYRAFQ